MNELLHYQKNAILNGLCDEWRQKWTLCHNDKEKLVRLAMMQQSIPHFLTYCYNGKGVSKDYIKKEYTQFINGSYKIKDADEVAGYTYELFVDCDDDITIDSDVVNVMWCKDTFVTIPETKCPTLYIGCKSDIELQLGGYNTIRIYLFDESRVTIYDADEVSKVLVYKYSDKAKVEKGKYCFGEVKVFEKELRL